MPMTPTNPPPPDPPVTRAEVDEVLATLDAYCDERVKHTLWSTIKRARATVERLATRPTPDDLADVLDLLDLLAPGVSAPIDPEHVRRVRRVVEGWGMGVPQ
jgi:hypothetical protein